MLQGLSLPAHCEKSGRRRFAHRCSAEVVLSILAFMYKEKGRRRRRKHNHADADAGVQWEGQHRAQ